MAHFAQLDLDDNVIQVIVVNNSDILDESGNESEEIGVNFCKNLLGGNWVQTSYNGSIRKNYAGRGFMYDRVRDAFIPPKPFPSWVLNENTCTWDPPVPHPLKDDPMGSSLGGPYVWNEEALQWDYRG